MYEDYSIDRAPTFTPWVGARMPGLYWCPWVNGESLRLSPQIFSIPLTTAGTFNLRGIFATSCMCGYRKVIGVISEKVASPSPSLFFLSGAPITCS